jgi:hypothetical protein
MEERTGFNQWLFNVSIICLVVEVLMRAVYAVRLAITAVATTAYVTPPADTTRYNYCHAATRLLHTPLSKCQIFAFNEPMDTWNQPRCCNIRVPPLRRFNEGIVEDMDSMVVESRRRVQVMLTF